MSEPSDEAELIRRASAVSADICGPVAPIRHEPLTVGELRAALDGLPDAMEVFVETPDDEIAAVEVFTEEPDFDGDDEFGFLNIILDGTRRAWYERIADASPPPPTPTPENER